MYKPVYIFFMALLFVSCSKGRCWECTVTSAQGATFQEQVCDKDKKQIQELQDNPQETKDPAGNVIYTTTYSNCIEQ